MITSLYVNMIKCLSNCVDQFQSVLYCMGVFKGFIFNVFLGMQHVFRGWQCGPFCYIDPGRNVNIYIQIHKNFLHPFLISLRKNSDHFYVPCPTLNQSCLQFVFRTCEHIFASKRAK